MAFRGPSERVKALVSAASEPTQRLFAKQEEFTIAESIFLKTWLQSVLEGRVDLAERLVDHGARAEHFRSLLSEYVAQIPDDALAIQTALNEDFDGHLKEFRDRNRPSEDERRDGPVKDYPA